MNIDMNIDMNEGFKEGVWVFARGDRRGVVI